MPKAVSNEVSNEAIEAPKKCVTRRTKKVSNEVSPEESKKRVTKRTKKVSEVPQEVSVEVSDESPKKRVTKRTTKVQEEVSDIVPDKVNIVPEMDELMAEIMKDGEFTETENETIDRYFTNDFKDANTRQYKYAVDADFFVIRRDCYNNPKNVYGWELVNGKPKAYISKTDLKKSKTDLSSSRSPYVKIFNIINKDLKEWLESE